MDRLREAGERLRTLRADDVLADLGRVLDEWSDPRSAPRRELARALPRTSGLGAATVAAGLDLALAPWNAAALARLAQREGAASTPPPRGVTAVIHGGVIPMPAIVDLLAPLLLRSPVLSRPGRHDPTTPRLVAESIAKHAPGLAEAVAVVEASHDDEPAWHAILAAERVCVTGGDAAVASVRERLAGGSRLIAHGHKLSVAWLGPDAEDRPAAGQLARDVALWDQQGCLSPVACWVLGRPERADGFARELSRALAERETAWPRGVVAVDAAAQIAHERAEAEMRAAAGRAVALHAGDAWTVVAEADAAPRPAPLHRFVRIHPVADLGSLAEALRPLAPHLAGVALSGFAEAQAAARAARSLGATRTSAFGRLQAPPLDWARDGLGVLASLRG